MSTSISIENKFGKKQGQKSMKIPKKQENQKMMDDNDNNNNRRINNTKPRKQRNKRKQKQKLRNLMDQTPSAQLKPNNSKINDNWSSEEEDEEEYKQQISSSTITTQKQDNNDPFASDDEEEIKPHQKPQKKRQKPDIIKPDIICDEEEKKVDPVKPRKPKLRSPICVVIGHVDAGKTEILDCIRCTKVGNNEIGHITQEIGATYLSIHYIKQKTKRLKKEHINKLKYKIPGLLFIDTPGHESFANLRSRGSSIADIAILVIDIMNGLQLNTIQSLNMLKKQKIPFIVAVNKIDKLNGWISQPNAPFLTSYKKQKKYTTDHFKKLISKIIVQFAEIAGLNAKLDTKLYAKLYSKNNNKRMDGDISLVPTSAKTGEGIADLLYLITQLKKSYISKILTLSPITKANILEVKKTIGYGTTIDVILSDGTLEKNDKIIICGMNGPIITSIRCLLLPNEAQEMRVKSEYKQIENVTASVGVRIVATNGLETAVAGTSLFVIPRYLNNKQKKDKIEELKLKVQESFINIYSKIDKYGGGVYVNGSSLGSLEALITFLNEHKIIVSGIDIGAISKKTVTKAINSKYKVILAFNVNVSDEIKQYAQIYGVKIFESKIIYHLQRDFENYMKTTICGPIIDKKLAIFPCEFKILSPQHIFNKKNPLVLGVQIMRGSLRLNTPICAKKIDSPIYLGRIDCIKSNNRNIEIARMGEKVSVRISAEEEEEKNIQIGRSFDISDLLISKISRQSIDSLKIHFKKEIMENNDMIKHIVELKKYFQITSNSLSNTNQSDEKNNDDADSKDGRKYSRNKPMIINNKDDNDNNDDDEDKFGKN